MMMCFCLFLFVCFIISHSSTCVGSLQGLGRGAWPRCVPGSLASSLSVFGFLRKYLVYFNQSYLTVLLVEKFISFYVRNDQRTHVAHRCGIGDMTQSSLRLLSLSVFYSRERGDENCA